MKEMYREIRERYGIKALEVKWIVNTFKDDMSVQTVAEWKKLDPDIVEDIIRRWMVAGEKKQ